MTRAKRHVREEASGSLRGTPASPQTHVRGAGIRCPDAWRVDAPAHQHGRARNGGWCPVADHGETEALLRKLELAARAGLTKGEAADLLAAVLGD